MADKKKETQVQGDLLGNQDQDEAVEQSQTEATVETTAPPAPKPVADDEDFTDDDLKSAMPEWDNDSESEDAAPTGRSIGEDKPTDPADVRHIVTDADGNVIEKLSAEAYKKRGLKPGETAYMV